MPPLKLPLASDVSEVKVSIPRAQAPEDVRVISEHVRIAEILTRIDGLNDSWYQPWDTFPTPQGTVSFHSGKDHLLVLWLGPNWLGGRDAIVHKSDGNRLRQLSPHDQSELLQLLGLKRRKQSTPGNEFEFDPK